MNFLIAYFLTGFVVFAWTFYRFVETGTFEKMTESGVKALGMFIFTSVFLHFFLWPLHVVMTALMALNPRATEAATRAVRRTFVDRDNRFTQPQMPAMCGSYKMEPPTEQGGQPSLHMCVKPRNHDGLHSNRDPRVPHDDALCPCTPMEWTTEESICMHTMVRMCVLHGEHEGKCKTAEGEEFEPTVPTAWPL